MVVLPENCAEKDGGVKFFLFFFGAGDTSPEENNVPPKRPSYRQLQSIAGSVLAGRGAVGDPYQLNDL
jgi:hypothetical protein